MSRVLGIFLLVFVTFVVEAVIHQVFGPWFRPDLLLILIVFFSLYRGTRYSLFAAVFAGLLKDSYGAGVFGASIFVYVACAYLTTYLKIFIYHAGSGASRALMVFLICVCSGALHYLLLVMFEEPVFGQMFRHVFVPEVLSTTVIAPYVYQKFRLCASRLFA